jgi:X-Pro dipeptidyl-peptidase
MRVSPPPVSGGTQAGRLATDVVIAAGHRLGLVVTGTDQEVQAPVRTGARIDVDLSASHLDLPMAGPKL